MSPYLFEASRIDLRDEVFTRRLFSLDTPRRIFALFIYDVIFTFEIPSVVRLQRTVESASLPAPL